MSGKDISREEGAQMPSVVPNHFKSNTREAEAGETLLVQCQPGLHSEFWNTQESIDFYGFSILKLQQ